MNGSEGITVELDGEQQGLARIVYGMDFLLAVSTVCEIGPIWSELEVSFEVTCDTQGEHIDWSTLETKGTQIGKDSSEDMQGRYVQHFSNHSTSVMTLVTPLALTGEVELNISTHVSE